MQPSPRRIRVLPLPVRRIIRYELVLFAALVLCFPTLLRAECLSRMELERWRVPEWRVLAGVAVKLNDPSVWDKYKLYFLAGLLFFGIETALVALLLAQIKRKVRAQRMLERRFAVERAVTDASERLANCPAGEVDAEIQHGLEEVLEAEKADRAIWFTVTEDGVVGEKQFFAIRNKSSRENRRCECEHLPWVMKQICQGKRVLMPGLESLPEDAESDRKYLESTNIQSMVVVPSRSDTEAKGTLVLVSYTPGREWPEALVSRLGMLANLFGNAVSRKRAEEQLHEKQEWLALALEASMTALWELDVQTGRVRWSQRQSPLLGNQPVELEASYQKFLELIPEEDRQDLYDRAKALLQNGGGKNEIVTEWRFHEPGGALKWLLFRGHVYRDERGRPLRLRGVNVDITDLKQAKMELIELTERLIRAQEEERQRLARELHDDIGQRLSLLIIQLDRMKEELPLELRILRDQVNGALGEASALATDIHGLSHQLHSSKLQHLGLKSAMRELCSQVSRQHGIEVELRAGPVPENISQEQALCFFRVAQEALKNAVKHSGSQRIRVDLAAEENTMEMRVRDYGCGFDLNHYEAGVGLASMRERLRMVGGSLDVRSAPGEGTEIVTLVGIKPLARHASAD